MIYKSHPELRIREVQADRESKAILRRLAHNTIDSLSGTVAKLAHSNPCIPFTNAVNLSHIIAYDNLANVIIQALRYRTLHDREPRPAQVPTVGHLGEGHGEMCYLGLT